MKLLLINSVLAFGSTGRIVLDIAKEYEQNGYEVKIAYGQARKTSKNLKPDIDKYGVRIGNNVDVYSHVLYTRLTDRHGLASKAATKRFLKWAENYNPDILWLHNIHDYYINYELLFAWIKLRPQMQVKWTLHDGWAFTGAPDLTIITPSNWLKEKVEQNFLSEYPVTVKYNTINTDIFKPTPSTFKQDHGIEDKKMVLGVANVWNNRKGLDDILELAKLLGNDYAVVIVGLSDKQKKDK